MKYAYATTKGVKIQNEDSILIGSKVMNDGLGESEEKVTIFAVADGVSSNKGGNIASRIVLEELSKLRDMLTKRFNLSRTASIEDLVEEISERILEGHNEAEEKEETINYLRHELTKIFDLTDYNHYYAEDIIAGIKKKVAGMNFKEDKK